MTDRVDMDVCFEPRADLVLEEIDDEVVILDLQNNVYFGLNEIAKRVWKGFEQQKSLGQLVAEIARDFDVDHEVVSRDVREFIDDALSNELISPVT